MTIPMTILAEGLLFPEGPVVMPDGSIVLVEIARGTVTRAWNGKAEVIATLGGGPNGAAIGPDGALYVTNNGGFRWHDVGGLLFPGDRPDDWSGGRIERVDLATGRHDVLYTECDGVPLKGPNDLVFDADGGFWFTDLGKSYGRLHDRGAVFYAKPDGSLIREALFPIDMPNGVGLSPDGGHLFVAQTMAGRLMRFPVESPGVIGQRSPFMNEECICGLPGFQLFDSLAVEADGTCTVATIAMPQGGLTSVRPDGTVEQVPLPDPLVTNVAFGGDGYRTAVVTLSATGRLAALDWPRAGLALNR